MSYKALLALQSAKGKFNKPIAYYEKGMMVLEIEKQELLNDIDKALENNEFEVWFQPQIYYIVCYKHGVGTGIDDYCGGRGNKGTGRYAFGIWLRADAGILFQQADSGREI